jgi:hypothetical protein
MKTDFINREGKMYHRTGCVLRFEGGDELGTNRSGMITAWGRNRYR